MTGVQTCALPISTDRSGETVMIDKAFVEKNLGDLARNTDLSKFIL